MTTYRSSWGSSSSDLDPIYQPHPWYTHGDRTSSYYDPTYDYDVTYPSRRKQSYVSKGRTDPEVYRLAKQMQYKEHAVRHSNPYHSKLGSTSSTRKYSVSGKTPGQYTAPYSSTKKESKEDESPLIWYHSSIPEERGGILQSKQTGATIPLSSTQTLPYHTTIIEPPKNQQFISYKSSTPANKAENKDLRKQQIPIGPTTLAAIDRANQIALHEEKGMVKPVAYTKIGGWTIDHSGSGYTKSYQSTARKTRTPLEVHTTTEAAYLRANTIALEEARRDEMNRKLTKRRGTYFTRWRYV